MDIEVEEEDMPENVKDAFDDLKKPRIVREMNGVYLQRGNLPE